MSIINTDSTISILIWIRNFILVACRNWFQKKNFYMFISVLNNSAYCSVRSVNIALYIFHSILVLIQTSVFSAGWLVLLCVTIHLQTNVFSVAHLTNFEVVHTTTVISSRNIMSNKKKMKMSPQLNLLILPISTLPFFWKLELENQKLFPTDWIVYSL